MTSTVWENMHEVPPLIISGDIKPWSGVSYTNVLDNVRLRSITINIGSTFDTAQLVYNGKSLGDEVDYFKPIKIVTVDGTGQEAREIILFRGFVVENDGALDTSKEEMTVQLRGYKWYLSKRTKVRGSWYAVGGLNNADNKSLLRGDDGYPVRGATNSPDQLGSGLTIGSSKFVYERFRALPQEDGGYLQHEECVFNRNGIPDCYTDNYISSLVIFYKPKIYWDERDGLRDNAWQAVGWKGKFWTWATILSHIEKYWIDPYNAQQTNVEIHRGDLAKIAGLDKAVNRPIDLPGRWYWYLDYSQPQVKIRIREFDTSKNSVFLKVCDENEKLALSEANVGSLSVRRNADKAVKYAIARGRKVKLVTTVKLVPLWPKYGNKKDRDFKNVADYKNWKTYATQKFYTKQGDVDQSVLKMDKEDRERYDKIYRAYGIAIKGETFGLNIVSERINDEDVEDDVKLTGKIGSEYAVFEQNLREFFFDGSKLKREITSPQYAGYSKKPVIFLFDSEMSEDVTRTNNQKTKHKKKSLTGVEYTDEEIKQLGNEARWIVVDETAKNKDRMKFEFDEESGTVTFDLPQFKREKEYSNDPIEEALFAMGKYTFDGGGVSGKKIISREVYMTATFTTDVAAILGREVENSIIDDFSGAPFSSYLDNNNIDILVHENAWYPINSKNRTQEAEDYKANQFMDGHATGKMIRRCHEFTQYKKYMGYGAEELLRALQGYLDGYKSLEENVSATIPYMETGFQLGDALRKIHGTEYTYLSCVLTVITWNAEDDSDSFSTVLSLSNYYAKEKSQNNYVTTKKKKRKPEIDSRDSFTFEDKLDSLE